MPHANKATPLYLTELAQENCKFYDTVAGFDVWMTPTNDLICQFGPSPSEYACMPYVLAKHMRNPIYKAAVSVVELHRSQGN